MARSTARDRIVTSEALWRQIRQVARDRGPCLVAVPYVGSNAGQQLRLRRGDTLVTRFDDATIRAGGVSPKAVGKYLRDGVAVFRADRLHAKVYVSANRAIVGSANLSESSEGYLLEAGIVTRTPRLVTQARRFVLDLAARSSFVGPELAKAKEKLYRPPIMLLRQRRSRRSEASSGPRLWLLQVTTAEPDANALSATKRAYRKIPIRPDSGRYTRDDIEIPESRSAARIRSGDELLQINETGRSIWLEPIAVVAAVQAFRSRRGARKRMIVVESRKGLRDRRLSSLKATLGSAAIRRLARVSGPAESRDSDFGERLRKLWAS